MKDARMTSSGNPTHPLTDWRVSSGREGEIPPDVGTQGTVSLDLDALKEGRLTAYVTRPGQPAGHSEVVQIELDAGTISISLAVAGAVEFGASMRALPSGEIMLSSEMPGETYVINGKSGKLEKVADWRAPENEVSRVPSPDHQDSPTP